MILGSPDSAFYTRAEQIWGPLGAEWVAKAMHMFTWLTPGEVMIADLDGLEEAKGWVAR